MPLFTGILSLILPAAKKETVKIPLHIKTAGRIASPGCFHALLFTGFRFAAAAPLIRCRLDRLHRIILNLLYPAGQEHGIYPGQIRPKPFVRVGLVLFPALFAGLVALIHLPHCVLSLMMKIHTAFHS